MRKGGAALQSGVAHHQLDATGGSEGEQTQRDSTGDWYSRI